MAPRQRLIAAMVAVASDHGYAAATVARVVAAAGVSRTTFYEHFRDREDCFMAAYEYAVDAIERRCREAFPGCDLHERVSGLLQAAAEEPALARMLLIESHAGSSGLRADHHRLLRRAEQRALDSPGGGLRLPPGALQGGLEAVVSPALLDDRPERLMELASDLGSWLRAYESACGEVCDEGEWHRLGCECAVNLSEHHQSVRSAEEEPSRRLPRGRNAAPSSFSAEHRRLRLLDATASVVAANGYAAASIGEIVAVAGVTRGAFYSHFGCKLDAFLATLVRHLQESAAKVAARFFVPDTWTDRVWCGLEELLRYMASHPEAAYLGLVEIYAAGEAALRRAAENRSALTLFLADGYHQNEQAASLPSLCSDAIAGAIEGVLRRQLLAGNGNRLVEQLPQCAYLALAPFIGCDTAWDLIVTRSQGGRREDRRVSSPELVPPVAAGSVLGGAPG